MHRVGAKGMEVLNIVIEVAEEIGQVLKIVLEMVDG